MTTKRVALGLLSLLTLLALWWHIEVSGRVSPDAWSRGEYAGAEKVLSGWRSSLCRGAGVCGNVMGHGKTSPGGKKPAGVRTAPEFVYEYGE